MFHCVGLADGIVLHPPVQAAYDSVFFLEGLGYLEPLELMLSVGAAKGAESTLGRPDLFLFLLETEGINSLSCVSTNTLPGLHSQTTFYFFGHRLCQITELSSRDWLRSKKITIFVTVKKSKKSVAP